MDKEDLLCAKVEAFNHVLNTMKQLEKEHLDKKLINFVREKKSTMIKKSKSIIKVRKIVRPSKPIKRFGFYEKLSEYHLDEEEFLLWPWYYQVQSPYHMLIIGIWCYFTDSIRKLLNNYMKRKLNSTERCKYNEN